MLEQNRKKKRAKSVKIAVIDLGTNSIRFDIYELKTDLNTSRIFRSKTMVRLGEEVFKSRKLGDKAMDRTLEEFKKFAQKIKSENVSKIIAFSTCALREASNAQEFVKRVLEETGIKVEVISGEQEAELISKGILTNEELPYDGLFSLVDIGGGSTEMSLCYKRTVLEQASLALGSSRLTQMFCTDSPLPVKQRKDMRKHIRSVMEPLTSKKLWKSTPSLVCSSGTAKAFLKIASALNMPVQPLDLRDLTQIINEIKNLDSTGILNYPGMEPKRVDIIISGGILLQEIARQTGAKQLYITEFNLRDGILENELEDFLSQKLKS